MKKVYYMSVSNFFPIDMKVNEAIKVCSNLVETFNKEEALRYLNLFNVPLKRKISKLSTGTQSLFKLSIALASNSEYLLFDEPILGLDANNRELFYRLLLEKQVENECGVILSTHLISEVSNIIEDVCAINNGKIIMMGNVEEILSNYYILSGPQEAVDEVSKDLEIISKKHLSGLATYGIKGTPPYKELPLGLSISSYNLQQLFIDITGEPVEERTI
ncbi:MAG: AAA family ATPase [Tissierellia bacterium]|nr:AAA family ATPase [Tissierellia bacterium]